MVFIYSTILRYLAQIIKGNKRLCYKEVISYSITKKLHIYGMNTIHMQSYPVSYTHLTLPTIA